MKKLILIVGAGSAALVAMVRRTAETVGEIRDMASGGSSIEVCPSCERVYAPQPFGRCEHCQRETAPPMPPVAHAGGSSQALAARIRSILGPRNDDSRTVVDLIDELCEELDRREPSIICGCGAFNGRARTSCYECGDPLEVPPSGPVRDRQLDRMNGVACPECRGEGRFDRGQGRTSCYECGQVLPPSDPADTIRFTARQNRGLCGLCDGVGVVDIGFGRSDTCGGCKGTGRVEA